ncbi:MAG: hypothetical protein ACI855_000186 [Myxococcota bacterium]
MKPVQLVPIQSPPKDQQYGRNARFADDGERRNRYHLPSKLSSSSPVGYRTRISLSTTETEEALGLLSMGRPTGFGPATDITDQMLFEESALGVLSARQSTNFRGHKQVTLGPADSAKLASLMRGLSHRDAAVLDGASHTNVVLCRPYRTPFTMLLTFIGHKAFRSLLTVPRRAFTKKVHHTDDIPTIGYLTELHVGILADAMERAPVIASAGVLRAQVHMTPFSGRHLTENKKALEPIYALCGVSRSDRRAGWRIAIIGQVGTALETERVTLSKTAARKFGANLLALRSERIQPGVNQEERAPASYQGRQTMSVDDELTVMCGRAAYNAFAHWTGVHRERAKDLLLLERVDVLHPEGKRRLREIRGELGDITDTVVANIPKWADYAMGKALTRNAAKGKKAFALAGQRIYIVGADKTECVAEGIDWQLAVRAAGAACSRSALVAELSGCTNIPEGCDLLAGICLMAGPVNQNDVGKTFYGFRDMLAGAHPSKDPTSLLMWTLKAKTVGDPIGNEEQLMNPARKGALVDLRCGPHEACSVRRSGDVIPFRQIGEQTSEARAFSDVGNFVTDAHGTDIPGNRGAEWPGKDTVLWPGVL